MKKSLYALLFSIVLALVTLIGCGGSGSVAAGGSGKVTLESAPDQPESASGNTQENSETDIQASELQSAPDQLDGELGGDDKAASYSGDNNSGSQSSTQDKPETSVNMPDAAANGAETSVNEPEAQINEPEATIDEDGTYTTKEDVALYIHVYGRLPKNFMTKKEAKKLGWEGGSLEKFAKGMCIGGDYFGNYEGILPRGSYHECDIDTLGRKSRGAKRIIYSDDGRIYYTEDHYETFELLYGEE